jgi:hypothetical protein
MYASKPTVDAEEQHVVHAEAHQEERDGPKQPLPEDVEIHRRPGDRAQDPKRRGRPHHEDAEDDQMHEAGGDQEQYHTRRSSP